MEKKRQTWEEWSDVKMEEENGGWWRERELGFVYIKKKGKGNG